MPTLCTTLGRDCPRTGHKTLGARLATMKVQQSTRSAPQALVRSVVLDAIVLLVFAAVGRRSHDEGNPIFGAIETAWPFLAGAAVGYLVLLIGVRRAVDSVLGGVVIWLCTLVVGMLLRQATDQGTAFSFMVVATCFTGVFMLGWRVVFGLLARRSS